MMGISTRVEIRFVSTGAGIGHMKRYRKDEYGTYVRSPDDTESDCATMIAVPISATILHQLDLQQI
jgi:hypothetical protein